MQNFYKYYYQRLVHIVPLLITKYLYLWSLQVKKSSFFAKKSSLLVKNLPVLVWLTRSSRGSIEAENEPMLTVGDGRMDRRNKSS